MNNLFAFHGADHKCGTTMIAQSVAELIADADKNIDVLLIHLNGRRSSEFVRENVEPIDYFKLQLDSGITISKASLSKNKKGKNLYVIAGLEKEIEERYYTPETAMHVLEDLGEKFQVIIADTGSQIDNGLAIGGISMAAKKFLVMTQNEVAIRRLEDLKSVYEKAGISFERFVINKYCNKDTYSLGYIAERLGMEKKSFDKVESVGYGRQAEMEYKTLLSFDKDKYTEDVLGLAQQICVDCGLEPLNYKRRGLWKSFI